MVVQEQNHRINNIQEQYTHLKLDCHFRSSVTRQIWREYARYLTTTWSWSADYGQFTLTPKYKLKVLDLSFLVSK